MKKYGENLNVNNYKMETDIGTHNIICAMGFFNSDEEAISHHQDFNATFLVGWLVHQRLFKKTGDEWALIWENGDKIKDAK